MQRVGFIGLGVMGRSMAEHLQSAFAPITIWNRTLAKADALLAMGAVLADSPAKLAERCDVVCLCVSDTPDVEQVVFGRDGIFSSIQPNTIIVDFSTISPRSTEQFARRVAEKGAQWLDAPVSGGDVGARNATLSIMVGGEQSTYERALPIFEKLGKKVVYMGSSGSGQRTKLANQIAVLGTIVSMAESLGYAKKSGMDVDRVLEVISAGAAGSWSLSNYGPRVLAGNFDPGFAVELMAKDMRLVLEELGDSQRDYPLVIHMKEVFDTMIRNGEGRLGIHAAVRYLGLN